MYELSSTTAFVNALSPHHLKDQKS